MSKISSLPSESLHWRIDIKNDCKLYCNNITSADMKNRSDQSVMCRWVIQENLRRDESKTKVSLEVLDLV